MKTQTDKRADKLFRKRYGAKGKQIWVFHTTLEYQLMVLGFRFQDLLKVIFCKKRS
jgi:hypothetical protein